MSGVAETLWQEPPDKSLLDPACLDVWRLRLSEPREHIQRLEQLLDDCQRQRADTYRYPHLRDRYVLRQGILRLILGWYVGVAPDQIRFEIGTHGKPRLSADFGAVHFNLSDSGDLALLVVSAGAEVGVDVEQIDDLAPPLEILPQLHDSERVAVESAGEDSRAQVLYQIWVRKEAYLKSLGQGIGLVQLHKFTVAGSGSLQNSDWKISTKDRTFHGCDLVADAKVIASVVSLKPIGTVRLFDASASWLQRTFHSSTRHKYLLALTR